MRLYIFRNYTVEQLFDKECRFSSYGGVEVPPDDFDAYALFCQLNPGSTPEQQLQEIDGIKTAINYIVEALPRNKRVIFFELSKYLSRDWSTISSLHNGIAAFNHEFLPKIASSFTRSQVISMDSFLLEFRETGMIDWRFFYLSQMVINPKLATPFKRWLDIQLNGIRPRKKCIILDCDNTLWGGVLGEEGSLGIQLGEDYPGKCYVQFQQLLAMAATKGIILAICSKNNYQDVTEVWKANPHNIINDSIISCCRIDWNDKASNIASIAAELNIGLDSIVFLDDNPVERELVKSFLPGVETPAFPAQPYGLVEFFWEVYSKYFLAQQFTNEDAARTRQYKENAERERVKTSFANIDDYISSLDISIDIYPAGDENIDRIAQMTQKTNQFNLTTRRYTVDEIRGLADAGDHVFCANVKDKYGDNGITLAFIGKKLAEGSVYIDSFLLSCRVLGRGVERAALTAILNDLFSRGITNIKAEYVPTSKNQQTANFFEEAGFEVVESKPGGGKVYEMRGKGNLELKPFYKINIHGRKGSGIDVRSV